VNDVRTTASITNGVAFLLIMVLTVGLVLGLAACRANESEDSALTPTEEEVISAFRQAELVYSWFTGYNQIEVDANSVVYMAGDPYYEVRQEGVTSRKGLYKCLCSYFPEALAQELIDLKVRDGHLFVDIEGRLYVFGGHVGIYTYDMVETELDIDYVSKEKIILSASISWNLDGKVHNCTYDYLYEKDESGKWVFTNFRLPAKLCVDSALSVSAIETLTLGDLTYHRHGNGWRLFDVGESARDAPDWQAQPEIEDLDDYFEAVQEARQWRLAIIEEIAVDDMGSNETTALAWMDAFFAVHQALPEDSMVHITDGIVDSFRILKTSREGLPLGFIFEVVYSVRPTYPIMRNSYWMAGNTAPSLGRDETWGQMYRQVALRMGDDGKYHFVDVGTGGVSVSSEF
jgi:hypothetical protein